MFCKQWEICLLKTDFFLLASPDHCRWIASESVTSKNICCFQSCFLWKPMYIFHLFKVCLLLEKEAFSRKVCLKRQPPYTVPHTTQQNWRSCVNSSFLALKSFYFTPTKHERCKLGLEWSAHPCSFFPNANTGEERVASVDSSVELFPPRSVTRGITGEVRSYLTVLPVVLHNTAGPSWAFFHGYVPFSFQCCPNGWALAGNWAEN